jgi:hypothetical protein
MIYGRPIGIHHSQAAKRQYIFPKAIDDQYISSGENQPANVPSLFAFFHYVAKLYCIVDDILDLLYETARAGWHDSNYSSTQSNHDMEDGRKPAALSMSTALPQMDRKLLSWHESLPDFLKFSIDAPTSDIGQHIAIQRQSNILRYRFLGIRILLHRQTLLYLLQPPERRQWLEAKHQRSSPLVTLQSGAVLQEAVSPFESSFARVSARICVSSAELLIECISVGRSLNLAGAWWWDFYCKLVYPHS